MTLYLKKPVVVDAMQFLDDPDRLIALQGFLGVNTLRINYTNKDKPFLTIPTQTGTDKVQVGEYIIRSFNGFFYRREKEPFEAIYEEIIPDPTE